MLLSGVRVALPAPENVSCVVRAFNESHVLLVVAWATPPAHKLPAALRLLEYKARPVPFSLLFSLLSSPLLSFLLFLFSCRSSLATLDACAAAAATSTRSSFSIPLFCFRVPCRAVPWRACHCHCHGHCFFAALLSRSSELNSSLGSCSQLAFYAFAFNPLHSNSEHRTCTQTVLRTPCLLLFAFLLTSLRFDSIQFALIRRTCVSSADIRHTTRRGVCR